jgi:hypothetical protein
MSISPPRATPLQLWLGLLAGVASLAALQASLLPRWPRAEPLPAAAAISGVLRKAGIAAEPLPNGPDISLGARSLELASSSTLAFRLTGGGEGAELRLLRGTARHRYNIHTAMFARDNKNLRLEQRRLLPGPPPLARGTIAGRDGLHTCWVETPSPGGSYGVTSEQLAPLVDRQAQGWQPALLRVIGLQPNRDFSCVLISLRSGSSAPLPPAILPGLLSALPTALQAVDPTDAATRPIP